MRPNTKAEIFVSGIAKLLLLLIIPDKYFLAVRHKLRFQCAWLKHKETNDCQTDYPKSAE